MPPNLGLKPNTAYGKQQTAYDIYQTKHKFRSLNNHTIWCHISVPDQVSDLQVVSKGSRWLVTNWTAAANPSNVGLYVLQISHNNRCEKQILFNVSGNVQVRISWQHGIWIRIRKMFSYYNNET